MEPEALQANPGLKFKDSNLEVDLIITKPDWHKFLQEYEEHLDPVKPLVPLMKKNPDLVFLSPEYKTFQAWQMTKDPRLFQTGFTKDIWLRTFMYKL